MLILLRFVHIISGAFWFGATMLAVRFLAPSMKAAGPAGGAVMAQLNQRKLSQAMMGAAILNVVSGVWMMFALSGGDIGAWMHLPSNQVFATGGTLATIALIAGMVVNAPAFKRLGALGAAVAKRGGPPSAEETAQMNALQARLQIGTIIVATLLFLAVTAMAVARYI